LINKVKYNFANLMDNSAMADHSFMFYDITLDSQLQKNPMQTFILEHENMKLYFQGGNIDLEEQALAFITRLLDGDIFLTRELPGEGPEDKVALAKELLSQQIIKIC
ncbi:hypothetical protein ACR71G_17950, partial [Xenorhabdus bovienii]|uniref:hypothetical protein n=1 Tax=Xenorhabdus bovienii TaxID=40576 RepID=UPI003DA315C7